MNDDVKIRAVPRLIKIETLAREWDVSQATLRRWAREGSIPGVRVGSTWRFDVADLRKLVAAHKQGK